MIFKPITFEVKVTLKTKSLYYNRDAQFGIKGTWYFSEND
mgnify:CR=1 FL=1